MFTFNDVSFRYRDYIFRQFSSEITESKIGIVGKNGVGKTTLLRLLDRQLHPQQGDVSANGSTYLVDFNLTKYAPFIIPDFIDLCSHLQSFDVTNASDILNSLFLNEYLDLPIGELSKGTKKKVSLLLGFMSTADILLLDEPFESLDPDSNEAIVRHIINRDGGVVTVSHDHAVLKQCVQSVYRVTHQRLEELSC